MKKILKENKVLIFLLFIFALEAILFSAGNSKIEQQIQAEERKFERLEKKLADLSLVAKSVSVDNLTTGRKLYGNNENAPMPLASLVKTMTAIVALDTYDRDSTLSLKEEAIKQNGDFGLFANEKWKVADLIKLTLTSSANDGAYMLSLNDDNFLDKMNSKAKRLGMDSTIFYNVTGLDIKKNDTELLDVPTKEGQAGAYGSAKDMNTLANYAILSYPEIFKATTAPELELKSESGFVHKVLNTNIIINKIPNIIFSKTGFTEIAGGNLSVVFQDKEGENIAVTLLGSTIDDRFVDMEKIVNVLYNK